MPVVLAGGGYKNLGSDLVGPLSPVLRPGEVHAMVSAE